MSPRISIATLLVCATPLACAAGERYDSATKGSGPLTVGVTQGSGVDDSDTDWDSDTADTDDSDTGPGETSESNGSDATGESSDSGDPTTTGPTSGGNMTWTTSSGSGGTTDDGCGGPCDSPPSSCFDMVGECNGVECLYYPLDAGAPCDDDDPCTDSDVCDGEGGCGGETITCDAPPHASGGTCVNGQCQGFKCEDPWENCDDDWGNGCEVPTGIANQCDSDGLNPDGGCWTAYCGSSGDAKATNFGTYYCVDCSTCHVPAEGMAQWCNHDTGNWYDPEVNSCGMWEDLVCTLG